MTEPVQIFDDVAFYWFLTSMLGIILLPITFYKIKHCCTSNKQPNKKLHPTIKSIPYYIPKNKLISNDLSKMNQLLLLQNIFFAFLWVLFVLLLIQLPRWHNSKIISFDPWELLKIAKASDENTIKKAYKAMAKKCHPDLCTKPPLAWTERKCRDCFILVRKAYELLTDEEAMNKWKNGGGDLDHTGIVMTIGLPTWLIDHPLAVLLMYFGALILLACIVTFWWKYSAQFHKSGVKKRSIEIFWKFIKPNMRLRHLLEILAASDEYRILDVLIANEQETKYKDFLALEREIIEMRKSRHMSMENIFNISYTRKCCALLTAHLLGIQVPISLTNEYLFVLQKAPHLIDVLIDMTLSRQGYWSQTLQLIQLKQAIFQSVWPNQSVLKQLPHWTPSIDKGIKDIGYNNILDLNFLKNDELKTVLYKIYKKYSDSSYLINNDEKLEYKSAEQTIDDEDINKMVEDAISCIRMYPFVKMRYCARTYAEKQTYKNDIVTVTVHLERVQDPSLLNQNKLKTVLEMKPPEFDINNKEIIDDDEDFTEKRRLQINRIEGPIVHVNRFPFRVNEKWLVILIDEENQTVIDYKAVADLSGLKKINLHFQANKQISGKHPYTLLAICDSYLGVEKRASFKININCQPKKNIDFNRNNVQEENDNLCDDEEKKIPIKWYYLWNANFWEFLLTLFLLYFIYLIVIPCSFGKKYLEPFVNVASNGFIEPIWNLIIGIIDDFIINPVTNQLLKETGINIINWWCGVQHNEMNDDEKEYFEYTQKEFDDINDE